jgi:hypothetical protein
MSPILFLFFGFFLAAVLCSYMILRDGGPGTGRYYGDPNQSREKFYDEFLVEVERLLILAQEQKFLSGIDVKDLQEMLAELTLIAPDNVIAVAKSLERYLLTSHRMQPTKEDADYFVLKNQFIATANKDIQVHR